MQPRLIIKIIKKLVNLFGILLNVAKSLPVILIMGLEKIRQNKIIVMHLDTPGFVQFLKPIYNEIVQRKIPVALFISCGQKIEKVSEIFHIMTSRIFPGSLTRYLFLTDLYIQPEIYDRGPKSAIRVMVGHGQPNKATSWTAENLSSFDAYFLYGPLLREMFDKIIEDEPEATEHIELFNVGYPKNDDLHNVRFSRDLILRENNLDPKKATILFAPAWDPGGALRTYGTTLIDALLSIQDTNVIVKLHPVSLEPGSSSKYEFYTGGKDWIKVMQSYEALPNFFHFKDYNINPMLAASDILVTDFSGVALEFMTQDKPVIYVDCPEFYNNTLVKWGQDPHLAKHDDRFNAGRNAGVIVHNLTELTEKVKQQLKHPGENSQKRQRITSRLLYNPGRGTKVAVDTIEYLLNRK